MVSDIIHSITLFVFILIQKTQPVVNDVQRLLCFVK